MSFEQAFGLLLLLLAGFIAFKIIRATIRLLGKFFGYVLLGKRGSITRRQRNKWNRFHKKFSEDMECKRIKRDEQRASTEIT